MTGNQKKIDCPSVIIPDQNLDRQFVALTVAGCVEIYEDKFGGKSTKGIALDLNTS